MSGLLALFQIHLLHPFRPTMNIYGKAMTDTKRQAHRKVVEMVLKSRKREEGNGKKEPLAVIGS